jgi:hypothetical protein
MSYRRAGIDVHKKMLAVVVSHLKQESPIQTSLFFFSRDEEKGPDGELLASGQNSILMDLNTFCLGEQKGDGIAGWRSILGIRYSSNC